MQSDLNSQIAATKRDLDGINADLAAVRKSIDQMVVQIEVVKKQYFALVAHVRLLDNQLVNVIEVEKMKRSELGTKKAELSSRIREAYDADRRAPRDVPVRRLLHRRRLRGQLHQRLRRARQGARRGDRRVQRALATIHAPWSCRPGPRPRPSGRALKQKQQLDAQLLELKAAQERLKELETETERQPSTATRWPSSSGTRRTSPRRSPRRRRPSGPSAQRSTRWSSSRSSSATSRTVQRPLIWPMKGVVPASTAAAPTRATDRASAPTSTTASTSFRRRAAAADRGRRPRPVGYIGWNYADGADPAWIVIIVHSKDVQTCTAHEGAPVPGAASGVGSRRGGSVIGYEGHTGHSTGPPSPLDGRVQRGVPEPEAVRLGPRGARLARAPARKPSGTKPSPPVTGVHTGC